MVGGSFVYHNVFITHFEKDELFAISISAFILLKKSAPIRGKNSCETSHFSVSWKMSPLILAVLAHYITKPFKNISIACSFEIIS